MRRRRRQWRQWREQALALHWRAAISAAGDGRAEAYASVCEQAALQAAAESGVPPDILTALTLTETGRKLNGRLRPWAWSVNADGAGTWFDEPGEALRFAQDRIDQGRTNVDIGCFQINFRWHGENFASVREMFDPLANARYAARFVSQLHAETGDWQARHDPSRDQCSGGDHVGTTRVHTGDRSDLGGRHGAEPGEYRVVLEPYAVEELSRVLRKAVRSARRHDARGCT